MKQRAIQPDDSPVDGPDMSIKQAIIFFKIPKVIIGENQNYKGAEEYLVSRGVEVQVLNDQACLQMLQDFDRQNPGAWNKG